MSSALTFITLAWLATIPITRAREAVVFENNPSIEQGSDQRFSLPESPYPGRRVRLTLQLDWKFLHPDDFTLPSRTIVSLFAIPCVTAGLHLECQALR